VVKGLKLKAALSEHMLRLFVQHIHMKLIFQKHITPKSDTTYLATSLEKSSSSEGPKRVLPQKGSEANSCSDSQ